MESFWDEAAEGFEASKKTYGTNLTNQVVDCLKNKGALHSESKVMDVGCGSGRYTIPFATVAKSVTAMDVSGKMLEICQEKALKSQIENIDYIKADWLTTAQNSSLLENKHSLIFASMCSAVKNLEGLRQMKSLSSEYCAIAQYIDMQDSLMKELINDGILPRKKDPHQGREDAWAIFNLLWIEGFQPEIIYLNRICDKPLSIEKAMDRYGMSLKDQAQRENLHQQLVKRCDSQGNLNAYNRTILSLIVWK